MLFSPYSLNLALEILANSVSGKSREEIINIIGTKHIPELPLDFANAVCVRPALKKSIARGYEKMLAEYHGELFASDNMAQDINAWVKEKTHGMISDIVDDSLEIDQAAILNAVAFESEWREPYEEEDVSEDEFTNIDGSVSKVQMMHSNENIYLEDDVFTGFVKPYAKSGFSFVALLPKEEQNFETMRSVLKKIDFDKPLGKTEYGVVEAYLPEFIADDAFELSSWLQEKGVKTVFTPVADFSPMSSERLKVDSVRQVNHIEVNCAGTRAAAATMITEEYGCAIFDVEVKTVKLDRPFIYAIVCETEEGSVLPVFVGIKDQF